MSVVPVAVSVLSDPMDLELQTVISHLSSTPGKIVFESTAPVGYFAIGLKNKQIDRIIF